MSDDAERIFIDCICSQSGKTWTAALERRYQMWVYAEHYLPRDFREVQERLRVKAKDARKQEIIRRLANLDNDSVPSLLPPDSVELDVELCPREVAHHEISAFGFECPYCGQTQPVTCPCCNKIECMGEVDSANRMICVGCGTILQFGGATNGNGNSGTGPKPVLIQSARASIVGHQRTLPQTDASRLLKGK